jgi:two-component system, OmpR family, response regulator QseB
MRILLVEDDPILGEGIATGLRQTDATVDWFRTAEDALAALATESFSVVVLDIGLPGMSGLQLLEVLRRQGNRTPVLLLTARDTVRDRVHGLNTGADDYLVKPFDLTELSARLQALSRRATGQSHSRLALRGFEIDFAARTCALGAVPIELSRREFAVLQVLVEHLGTVLSRQRIEQALYAWGEEVESNTVEVHIHHLRKKLGSELIRTARGVGYAIDAER